MCAARPGRRAHRTVSTFGASMDATVVPHEPAPITAAFTRPPRFPDQGTAFDTTLHAGPCNRGSPRRRFVQHLNGESGGPLTSTNYVLDTCVLLADPHAPLRFDEHSVVLPLVVVEELDRQKKRMDEVGANARSAIRLLEGLGASEPGGLASPTSLPGGGSLRIELNGITSERLPIVLDPNTADHRILATCLNLVDEGTRTVLVTKDAALRIKGAQLGVTVEDYRGDTVQVDEAAWPDGSPRVAARQEQQLIDEPAQALALFQHTGQQFVLLIRLQRAPHGHFDFCAQHGQRRAQLVRSIGGEAPDLVEGLFQPGDHVVDRAGQSTQFVVGVFHGKPLAEPIGCDAVRLAAQLFDGGQGAARQAIGDGSGQHQCSRQRRKQYRADPPEVRLHLIQGCHQEHRHGAAGRAQPG
ncbi:MAG TPA: hypothetical protein EYP56_16665 [Planctomycetaceae bacterium]|nr:hypothetical protein [Planctomycetaceae bacterium]